MSRPAPVDAEPASKRPRALLADDRTLYAPAIGQAKKVLTGDRDADHYLFHKFIKHAESGGERAHGGAIYSYHASDYVPSDFDAMRIVSKGFHREVPSALSIATQKYFNSFVWVEEWLATLPANFNMYRYNLSNLPVERGERMVLMPPHASSSTFFTHSYKIQARRQGWDAFLARTIPDALVRASMEVRFHALVDQLVVKYRWRANPDTWFKGITPSAPAGRESTALEALMQLGLHRGMRCADGQFSMMLAAVTAVYGAKTAQVAITWMMILNAFHHPFSMGARMFGDTAISSFEWCQKLRDEPFPWSDAVIQNVWLADVLRDDLARAQARVDAGLPPLIE